MGFKESQELAEVTRIGVARRRTLSALGDDLRQPSCDGVPKIAPQREFRVRSQNFIK
jgi:hypothetical protein